METQILRVIANNVSECHVLRSRQREAGAAGNVCFQVFSGAVGERAGASGGCGRPRPGPPERTACGAGLPQRTPGKVQPGGPEPAGLGSLQNRDTWARAGQRERAAWRSGSWRAG